MNLSLELSSFITLSYDIEPLKNLYSTYHVRSNFEENAKAIAEQLKSYPKKYDNDPFSIFLL